ncbi:MAG: hypothetical protein BA870_02835 [Desulfuromonadales bacterium C00003094]|nr:MAG: hypothetical protein BA870_02835 [Desulfuromonadales bacterium C00003094]
MFTQLVEIEHLKIGAELYLALLRIQFSEQQLEQGRLAGAIGTDYTDAVATQYGAGKVFNQRALVVAEAQPLDLGHQFATATGFIHLQIDRTCAITPLTVLFAHLL